MQNKWAVGGVFVVVAAAIVGLALWLSPGKSPATRPGNQPQPIVAVPVAPSGTDTRLAGAGATAEMVAAAPTTAAAVGQPAKPKDAAANLAAEDPTTTTDPVVPAVPAVPVTTPTGPTVREAPVAWCRTPDGLWHSGAGEDCYPDSPDFVEFR